MTAFSRNATLVAIVGGLYLGAFLVVLAPTSRQFDWKNFHVEDSGMYSEMAEMLATGGILADDPSYHDYSRARMPLYPLLLGGLRFGGGLIGASPWAMATIVNVLLVLASGALLQYGLFRSLGDQRIAAVAALSMIVAPGTAPFVFAQMPEPATLFFWSASAACLLTSNRTWSTVSAGLLAGAALLTKPFSLPVAIVTIPLLFVVDRSLRRGLLFSIGFAPLPVLWVIRNWLVWGVVAISPNSGMHLYDYVRPLFLGAQGRAVVPLHPLTNSAPDPRLPEDRDQWRDKLGFDFDNLGKRYALLAKLANADISSDPVTYAKLCLTKHWRLYAGTGTQALYSMSLGDPTLARLAQREPDWIWTSHLWVFQGISSALLLAFYALAVAGAWYGWKDRNLRVAVVICLLMLALQAAVIGPFGHTRYRFLMTPFFGVLAAIGLAKLRSRQDKIVPVNDLFPAGTGK